MINENLIVAPSILSADFSKMREEVESIRESTAPWIHIDVMDGQFVPNITFGPKFIKDIRKHSDLVFDTHLMIDRPERYIEDFAKAGSDYITVHSEATVHLHRTLQQIKDCGVKAGVAIVPSTPVCMIEGILDMVDEVLIMSVNPGFGGQSLIPSVLSKVSDLAYIRKNEDYNFLINIDGGVNLKTVQDVVAAGVDCTVAGSAFFGAANRYEFVKEMERLAKNI